MHRKLGRSSKQALGISTAMLEKMISTAKNDLWGLRDIALILLAYDSLCRRSELVSLRIEDIEFSESSLPRSIRLRRSNWKSNKINCKNTASD
jgi:integrase